jgi:Thioredoxin
MKKVVLLGILVAVLIVAAAIGSFYKLKIEPFMDKDASPRQSGGAGGVVCEYFAMEGCPHCVKFDPVWRQVVEKFSGQSGVVFKRWNVSEPGGKKAAQAAGVSGFPHVRKTVKGVVTEFSGERTVDALEIFLKK